MKKKKLIDRLALRTLEALASALAPWEATLDWCHGSGVLGDYGADGTLVNCLEITVNGKLVGVAICEDGEIEVINRDASEFVRLTTADVAAIIAAASALTA